MRNWLQKLASISLSAILGFSTIMPVFAQQQGEGVFKVMDTTAGQPAFVMLTGNPTDVVDLSFINPYQGVINQKFQLDENGLLQYWYPMAVIAGEYTVVYKGMSSSFTVHPGLPDTVSSSLDLEDYTSYVGEKVNGTLQLKDRFGNIISGREVEISSKGSLSIDCHGSCRTDQLGNIQLSFSSQKAGLKQITISDKKTGGVIFKEELGFIPQVQLDRRRTQFNTYGMVNQWQMNTPESTYDFDYLPILDPSRATFTAQGNNDQYMANNWLDNGLMDYAAADLIQSSFGLLAQAESNPLENLGSTHQVAQLEKQDFHIIFGDEDEEAEFKEEVIVSANTALDFNVIAVDEAGNIKKDYIGEIEFQLSPKGPLLPADYNFSEIDQGKSFFELALILPVGEYTLKVIDKANQSLMGEIKIQAQLEGIPKLNNTNVILNLDSPIVNSTYAGTFSVQGSVNTDNTEIVVSEGGKEIKRVAVDENLQFNFPVDLNDGVHKLDIKAVYLVDGSETAALVDLEVDKTAPVIIQVDSNIPPVRAGELFTMKVQAEENSILKAFINNRAYEFVGEGTQYTLNTKAPLDAGDFPINLQISDTFGNIETAQEVATLTVTEAMQEIGNLFGIPGIGTITLSWEPLIGAASYDISFKSILGTNEESFNQTETRKTIENLAPNVSYVFTVTALDSSGVALSKPTKSRALKALEAPALSGQPVVSTPVPDRPVLKAAADVQTTPARHTSSGPEIYVLILLSVFLLNGYGRLRKRLAIADIRSSDIF